MQCLMNTSYTPVLPHRRVKPGSSLKSDRQRFQSPKEHVWAPVEVDLGKTKVQEALNQRADGDLTLNPRERGSKTEVWPVAEGKMAIVAPTEVQVSGSANTDGSRLAAPSIRSTCSPRCSCWPRRTKSSATLRKVA